MEMAGIKWSKRGAKILATFVTGYSGGLGVVFPLEALNHWGITIEGLILYPTISGLIVALPQISKVLIEYGNS